MYEWMDGCQMRMLFDVHLMVEEPHRHLSILLLRCFLISLCRYCRGAGKMNHESMAAARDSITIESKAIEETLSYLDVDAFTRAVDALRVAERIITCASGSSGIAAAKFAHSLCCIERPARFLSPADAVHGGLGCICRHDVVVMVSRGGKTVELLPILDGLRKKDAFLIGLTENMDSPLARTSDVILPLHISRESDPLNCMATASFVATIALFDALLSALIIETGYTLEKFALNHPGGAVGARLNKTHRLPDS